MDQNDAHDPSNPGEDPREKALSQPWLLVASPQLTDPNFKKSVVLMVEQSSSGALGFIINRPVQSSLADLVSLPGVEIPDHIPAWFGGPVDTGTGVIIHKRTDVTADGQTPCGFALSSSEGTLRDMVNWSHNHRIIPTAPGAATAPATADSVLYPYRFIVGYAGWSAAQLKREIRDGAWLQVAVTDELLFHVRWQDLWDRCIGMAGHNPKMLVTPHHQYLH